MKCYVMTRKGSFTPTEHTNNQCKAKMHLAYTYVIKIAFTGKAQLDKKDFLIEHEAIDAQIQKTKLKGSCERMAAVITDSLLALLTKAGLPVAILKTTIHPVENPPAFMEHLYIKNKNYNYLLPQV